MYLIEGSISRLNICWQGTRTSRNTCPLTKSHRTKVSEVTGKVVENTLVLADITVNKNMVPFDSRSPFQTSGIRVGTPAITTRGVKEDLIPEIVGLMDKIIVDIENPDIIPVVKSKVNKLMSGFPMFAEW